MNPDLARQWFLQNKGRNRYVVRCLEDTLRAALLAITRITRNHEDCMERFEERAAILEYDGGYSRQMAEALA